MTEIKLFKRKYGDRSVGDKAYIGAQLPEEQISHIVLYSMVNGCSKSETLRSIIDYWAGNSDESDIDNLVDRFIYLAKSDFNIRKKKFVDAEEFLMEVQVKLKDRGVTLATINKIMDGLNEIKQWKERERKS